MAVKLKFIISLALLSFLVLSGTANSEDQNISVIKPIIFEVIGQNVVLVNGVNTTLKGSWQEAMNHISPNKNNHYKIINKSSLLKQTSLIKEYMATVKKTTGIEITYIE